MFMIMLMLLTCILRFQTVMFKGIRGAVYDVLRVDLSMPDSWLNIHFTNSQVSQHCPQFHGIFTPLHSQAFSAIDLDIRHAFFIVVRFSLIFHELLLGCK
jgi:hypothetical protein